MVTFLIHNSSRCKVAGARARRCWPHPPGGRFARTSRRSPAGRPPRSPRPPDAAGQFRKRRVHVAGGVDRVRGRTAWRTRVGKPTCRWRSLVGPCRPQVMIGASPIRSAAHHRHGVTVDPAVRTPTSYPVGRMSVGNSTGCRHALRHLVHAGLAERTWRTRCSRRSGAKSSPPHDLHCSLGIARCSSHSAA